MSLAGESAVLSDPVAPRLPSTTAEHALDWLRRAVVGGQLEPGQHVIQEDVVEQLGISIAPVREALRILEQEGQVTYKRRRGTSWLSCADS
jgi:DNA-binding GntR family transcriptional regulator